MYVCLACWPHMSALIWRFFLWWKGLENKLVKKLCSRNDGDIKTQHHLPQKYLLHTAIKNLSGATLAAASNFIEYKCCEFDLNKKAKTFLVSRLKTRIRPHESLLLFTRFVDNVVEFFWQLHIQCAMFRCRFLH
jgi:hypothetical protein